MSEIIMRVKCSENDRIADELKKELGLPLNIKEGKAFSPVHKIKRALRLLRLLKGDDISYGFEKEPELVDKDLSEFDRKEGMLLKFISEKDLNELDEYFKELSRIEEFRNITVYDIDRLLTQEYSRGHHLEGSISDRFNERYQNICKRFRGAFQY